MQYQCGRSMHAVDNFIIMLKRHSVPSKLKAATKTPAATTTITNKNIACVIPATSGVKTSESSSATTCQN